jgi:hypothetical protein
VIIDLALSHRFLRTRATPGIHLCTCLYYEPVEVRSADILRFKPTLRYVRYCVIAAGHVRVEIEGEHRSLLKSDDIFIVPAGRGFNVQNSTYDAVTIYVYTRVLAAPGTSSNRMEGMPYQPANPPLHYAGSRPSRKYHPWSRSVRALMTSLPNRCNPPDKSVPVQERELRILPLCPLRHHHPRSWREGLLSARQ